MLPKTPASLLALTVACGAGAALTPAAQAAYPGDNGQVAFVKHVGEGTYHLHVADADGTDVRDVTPELTGIAGHPSWSPDGRTIAYQLGGEGTPELRLLDPATGVDVSLDEHGENPTWSPDGTKIAFEAAGDIWVRSSDPASTADPVLLTPGPGVDSDPAWSDKDEIAFIRREQSSNENVFVMPATGDGDGGAFPVSRHGDDERTPDWSPDGTKLAYVRDDGAGGEIYVHTINGAATAFQPDGAVIDTDPAWSPDGTRIVWRSTRAWADVAGTRLWTANPAHDATPAIPIGHDTPADGIAGLQPDWQPIVDAPEEPQEPQEPEQPEEPKDDEPKEEPKHEEPRSEQPPTPQPQPQPAPQVTPRTTVVASRSCVSRRRFTITLPSKGHAVTSATATLGGKALRVTIGKKGRAVVDLRKRPKGTFTVRITVTTSAGTITQTRRFKTCAPKKRA